MISFLQKNRGRKLLEHEVKGMLKDMGIPVPRGVFLPKGAPLSSVNSQLSSLSYPLIAKVSSQKIASKSDVKGIRPGIENEDELKQAFEELIRIQDAEGILIEETAPDGLEVIVGGIIDKQFGPVVMFGLGGVLVELFRDTAFALAPLKKEDAVWLIQQVKGYKLIEGYRGNPPLDKEELIRVILAVSEVISTGLVEEIDINPVALYPEGAIVLDAKMAVK